MREREADISAQFRIGSREGEGSEIELTVPANIAFAARERAWQRWTGRIQPRKSLTA
jgi:hypothetical protein